jgi:hypothetical protein
MKSVRRKTMVSRKAFLSLCAVVLSVFGVDAFARDYYISVGGDDANPGTQAQPWHSIDKVNTTDFDPGDCILFEGGETFGGTIRFDKDDSGTSEQKIVVTSYGLGSAIIKGGSGRALAANGCSHFVVKKLKFIGAGRKTGSEDAGIVVHEGEDVEIDNVDVSGFRLGGVSFSGVRNGRMTKVYAHDNGATGITAGASGYRWCEDIYIGYCVAENNPGDPCNLTNHSGNGIVVGNVTGAVIEYCEAFNNGWDMPREGNGPVGIWAWNAKNVTIQFCISHGNKSPGHDGGGFDLDGGLTNSILQYNLSYDNEGPGYFLCQYPTAPVFKNNVIRYNISQNDGFKTNRTSGIDVYAGDVGMSDCEIYNNTVYNSKGAGIAFGGLDVPGIVIRNNIFMCAGELIHGKSKRGRFENNVYWPIGDGKMTFDGYESFDEWVAATGQEKIGETIVGKYVDPKLVEPGTADLTDPRELDKLAQYRLKADSPCIGAGIPIENNGGRDLWGTKVPEDGKPDIGSCQMP